jgi:hypothetical protein
VECKEAALPDQSDLVGAKYSFDDDVVLSDSDSEDDDEDSDSDDDSASDNGSESEDGGKKKSKSKKQKQREQEKRKKEKRKEKKKEKKMKEAEKVEKNKAKAMGASKRKRADKEDGGEEGPAKCQRSGEEGRTVDGIPTVEERRQRELTLDQQRERNIVLRKEALRQLDDAWYEKHPEQRPPAPKPRTKRIPAPKGSVAPVRRSTRQIGTTAPGK